MDKVLKRRYALEEFRQILEYAARYWDEEAEEAREAGVPTDCEGYKRTAKSFRSVAGSVDSWIRIWESNNGRPLPHPGQRCSEKGV
ncbi:MAG: hypothetical protein M1379_03805 [Firmicutes bacterium]|nr:hypothetical protein [Bacillota bacterium]